MKGKVRVQKKLKTGRLREGPREERQTDKERGERERLRVRI